MLHSKKLCCEKRDNQTSCCCIIPSQRPAQTVTPALCRHRNTERQRCLPCRAMLLAAPGGPMWLWPWQQCTLQTSQCQACGVATTAAAAAARSPCFLSCNTAACGAACCSVYTFLRVQPDIPGMGTTFVCEFWELLHKINDNWTDDLVINSVAVTSPAGSHPPTAGRVRCRPGSTGMQQTTAEDSCPCRSLASVCCFPYTP